MHSTQQNYERQKFLFYVAQDLDDYVRKSVQQLVDSLAASREWTIAPPSFIDEIDTNGFEFLGGVLEIYSAFPPNNLPVEEDLKNLEEVEEVIGAVRDLSGKEKISFDFQLGAEYVGSIEDGLVDRLLQEGLIVPWRDNLNSQF